MTTSATTRIDLLILGLLLDRPMHGYELHQQIQAEGIDAWFNISMASVYYSLGKLRDHGLVAESRQRGAHSVRKSTYHLTEEGRATFFATMEAQATNQDKTCLEYDLVIYLLNKLPLQQAISLLEKRQAFLAQETQTVQAALVAEQNDGQSPLKLAILDHAHRFLEMERGWLADVILDIRGGEESRYAQASAQRGLMTLSGDLHRHHLPDLIRLIVSGQHSGRLTVTDGTAIRILGFEKGRPVCAACLQQNEPPPLPPPPPEQILEGLYDLFRWQEGQFTFDQRTECEEWCVPLQISAEDLILRGCRWVDNWTIIQKLVPSADAIFEVGGAPQRLSDLPLAPTEKQIVAAVDGVKDVATIARDLGLTLFEASRGFYCLAAAGVVRSADLSKIRLRRVFREIAELLCHSTLPWRSSPEDRSCEEEVNALSKNLPLRLNEGRIEDQANPRLRIEELVALYKSFLSIQLDVIGRRFGRKNALQSFEQVLNQLAPELQEVSAKHGFDDLIN